MVRQVLAALYCPDCFISAAMRLVNVSTVVSIMTVFMRLYSVTNV